MLKSGGIFARFANHPYRAKNDTALAVEMDRIYAEYYYPFHHKKPAVPTEYSEKQAMQRATTAEKYGFTNIDYALFHSILLGTYSDHIAIEQNIREKFFSEIEDAIRRHGGSITLYDTIDLQLAKKP